VAASIFVENKMSQCNYCSFKALKRNKKNKHRIFKQPASNYSLVGINIYEVPIGDKLDHNKHFVSWYMELPDSCAC